MNKKIILGLGLIVLMSVTSFDSAGLSIIINNGGGGNPPVQYSFNGKVMNQYGKVIPDVQVNFAFSNSSYNTYAVSDGSGQYSVSQNIVSSELSSGLTVTVTASRPGYADFSGQFVINGTTANPKEVDVYFQRPYPSGQNDFLLEGLVKDYQTGNVIPGALITIWGACPTIKCKPDLQTTTDSNGYFYAYDSSFDQVYEVDVNATNYVTYFTGVPYYMGGTYYDYHYMTFQLSSLGYTTFQGQVYGNMLNGSKDSLAGVNVSVLSVNTGKVLASTNPDTFGHYYISIPSNPSDQFKIEFYETGFTYAIYTDSGNPGNNYQDVTLVQQSITQTNILDVLFMSVKKQANIFLKEALDLGWPVGTTLPFSFSFNVPEGVSFGIAFSLTRTGAYNVSVNCSDTPGNPGLYVRIPLPPPLAPAKLELNGGFLGHLYDGDNDIFTFNDFTFVLDSITFGSAIGIYVSGSLMDLLHQEQSENDKASISKTQKIENTLYNGLISHLDPLSFSFTAEAGYLITINNGNQLQGNATTSSAASSSKSFNNGGLNVNSIDLQIYGYLGASVSLDTSVNYNFYINQWLNFNLLSAHLYGSIDASATLTVVNGVLSFSSNTLTISLLALKAEVSATLNLDFSALGQSYHYNLFNFYYGRTVNPLFTFTINLPNPSPPSAPTSPAITLSSTNVEIGSQMGLSVVSTDPQGSTLTYSINWGDGSSPTTSTALNSGTSYGSSHTYYKRGTFTIVVTVTNKYSLSSSSQASLTIYGSPPTGPAITVSSTNILVGNSMSLSASSTDPQGTSITYSIYWGDGGLTTSSALNSGTSYGASHSYSYTGSFTITVTVTDIYGLSSTGYKTITVYNNPPNTPPAPTGPSSGYGGATYTFSFYGSDPDGQAIKFVVTWGDGGHYTSGYYSSGSTVSISHYYNPANSADFYINYYLVDTYGASSSSSAYHTILITVIKPCAITSSIAGPARICGITSPSATQTSSTGNIQISSTGVPQTNNAGITQTSSTGVTQTISTGVMQTKQTNTMITTKSISTKTIDNSQNLNSLFYTDQIDN